MTGLVKFERFVRRAGGTLAITIPPEIQRAVGLKEGQAVELYVTDERKIVIQLKEKTRKEG